VAAADNNLLTEALIKGASNAFCAVALIGGLGGGVTHLACHLDTAARKE